MKRKSLTLELRHIGILFLVKALALFSQLKLKRLLDLLSLHAPTFSCHATQKLGFSNVFYSKKSHCRIKTLQNVQFLQASEGKVINSDGKVIFTDFQWYMTMSIENQE